ncbi:MAG: hypothetical protein KA419_11695 [Acidobacteria bacterium]|nr:hypothetical protein [Acidobacteriota bacterium]
MTRIIRAGLTVYAVWVSLASSGAVRASGDPPLPKTRAELTDYGETSSFQDVVDFIRTLQQASPHLRVETLLRTLEGREVPLVVAGDPLPSSPVEALRDGRPVLYLQANIHAGEVEGKEALQVFLRELVAGRHRDWLRRGIFLVVPIFNADGNEPVSPANRNYMPNPAKGVGQRATIANLDINRDYVKTETREVRAVLEKVLLRWDPLVYLDIHTTDGSYHRETVTYTSPMGPNWDPALSRFLWDRLYPAVDRALRAQGIASLPYGDFKDDLKPESGWVSFPSSPRVGVDYVALRNRFASLLEMYAYIPFSTRVTHCTAFVDTWIGFVLDHAPEMSVIARDADQRAAAVASLPAAERPKLSLKVDTQSLDKPLTVETYEVEPFTSPLGYPRFKPVLDKPKTVSVPHFRRFVSLHDTTLPAAYALAPGCVPAVRQLLRHGIAVSRVVRKSRVEAEHFEPSSIALDTWLSEGHVRVSLSGLWTPAAVDLEPGWFVVRTAQPLSMLATLLLEPEHPDSLVSWNFFDSHLTQQWTRKLRPLPYVRINELGPLVTQTITSADLD